MKKLQYVLRFLLFILISSVALMGPAQNPGKDSLFRKSYVLNIMQRTADWQLANFTSNGFKRPKYDWTYAALYTGIMELGKISSDKKYLEFLLNTGHDLNWNTGARRFHADDYCVAQTYCNLYFLYRDEKMISPFRLLADSIAAQPHNESLEWKNQIQDREWAWCDALFMAPTSLSFLSTATGDKKYLDIASKL